MTFHCMEDCVWTIVRTKIILLYFLKWTKARCGPIETLCCKELYWNMTLSETNNKKIPVSAKDIFFLDVFYTHKHSIKSRSNTYII